VNYNIVIIGSGAREHALAYSMDRSKRQFPGHQNCCIHCFGTTMNPAIRTICQKNNGFYEFGDIVDPQSVLQFCLMTKADLVLIGPEAPLETGTGDILRKHAIAVFGPGRQQAQIETSKSFAREFLSKTLPQACPKFAVVSSLEAAKDFLLELGMHFVIKADGLTGGKGVKVSQDHLHGLDEALAYCQELLTQPNARCVIEEKLYGEEFSLMTITDGQQCIHFPAVQDHKRAYDGDTGPNTGGMGSYSCADHSLPFLSENDITTARLYNEQVVAALSAQCQEPYRGILYGGFMAVSDGIRIIEYNARFGDPEALNLLSLIESDTIELFSRSATGRLYGHVACFANKASVCKYAVPPGYPLKVEKGIPIHMDAVDEEVQVYVGSVDEMPDGTLVTAGSRTLAIVAMEQDLSSAEALVETNLQKLSGGLRHRRDIGTQPLIQKRMEHMEKLRRPVRLGVLGSTQGTDLQYLIESISAEKLEAEIVLVVSDRKDAGILTRARNHGIPAHHYSFYRKEREEQEKNISDACKEARVDLILLIGYMRILSPWFCTVWKNKILNVHPSLLPDFAGGMDSDVHAAAIDRMKTTGESITGCTVHVVSPEVDQGTILIQKRCSIQKDDTALTLKKRVQELEGLALVEVVSYFHKSAGMDPNWEGLV
jgi:formyltetrahydrofolate-dependent phosphoribosylglycinamide formyltransferase